jgi:hypothetical protein
VFLSTDNESPVENSEFLLWHLSYFLFHINLNLHVDDGLQE